MIGNCLGRTCRLLSFVVRWPQPFHWKIPKVTVFSLRLFFFLWRRTPTLQSSSSIEVRQEKDSGEGISPFVIRLLLSLLVFTPLSSIPISDSQKSISQFIQGLTLLPLAWWCDQMAEHGTEERVWKSCPPVQTLSQVSYLHPLCSPFTLPSWWSLRDSLQQVSSLSSLLSSINCHSFNHFPSFKILLQPLVFSFHMFFFLSNHLPFHSFSIILDEAKGADLLVVNLNKMLSP